MVVLVLVLPVGAARAGTDWPSYAFDLQRDGFNSAESSLGPQNVGQLGELWSTTVSSGVTAQPVVAAGVAVGGSTEDLVYVGSEHGDFYALDAATGAVVWQRNLGAHAFSTCQDSPDGSTLGVTGTAAIDRTAGLVYVAGGDNKVHALDLATGVEASGWPVSLGLDAAHEHVWAGLTLANGKLYVGNASDGCDTTPYVGRLIQIDTTTRAISTWYPTSTPNGNLDGAGIWSWGGVSVDSASGDIFMATGNTIGSDESAGYGEHVVRLTSSLGVVASNYPGLDGFDVDFGSTPVLFQPPGCPEEAAVENKSGVVVLYNAGSIGTGPLQLIKLSDYVDGGELIGVPAYSQAAHKLYVSSPTDLTGGPFVHGLVAFDVGTDCKLKLSWNATAGINGAVTSSPSIADGVVYYGNGPGDQLLAYDASTGAPLWNSGATIGGPVFGAPSIVGGRVFVGSWDGKVYAFAPGTRTPTTLGDAGVGSLVDTGGAGYLDLSGSYSLAGQATVSELHAYVAGGSALSHLRAVIYGDSGGKPAGLQATTVEVTIPAGQSARWVTLSLPSPVTLAAGSYWLGYWYGDGNSRHFYTSQAGEERYAKVAYSSTASPPASYPTSNNTSSSRYSLYAVVTSGGGGGGTAAAPSAPTLAASAADGVVHLSWTAPSDGGSPLTGYRVYRSTSAGKETALVDVGPSATSYDDTTVSNGTTYFYELTALNAIGESARSGEVSASPAAASSSGTLGDAGVGSLVDTGGAGYLDLSGSYSLAGQATVSELHAYVAGGSALSHLRAVIYGDSGGKPAGLQATTVEVTIPAGQSARWVTLSLPSPVTLAAGSYWLGYWYGDGNSRHFYTSQAGEERYAKVAYSSTASPPASYPTSNNTSSSRYSLYATYTTG